MAAWEVTSFTSITCRFGKNDSTFLINPDLGSRSRVMHRDLGMDARISISSGSFSNM